MSAELKILRASPSLSIQDQGRPGYGRFGLSKGGAMDVYALAEGAALLGNSQDHAAIEMAGFGGSFQVNKPCWLALTGAPMKVSIDKTPIEWRTSFCLEPEQILEVGSATIGTYGYLHIDGGIDIKPQMHSRSTHLRAAVGGIDGKVLQDGQRLPIGTPGQNISEQKLPTPTYLSQQTIRLQWSPQTHRFKEETRQRFLTEQFSISHRRDRMAMRLNLSEGQAPFEALLTGVSDPIQDGDIQMTGDGVPAILVREHQPTGGYPRIATVISADLAAVAQLATDQPFRFALVNQQQAVQELKDWRDGIAKLASAVQPVIRSAQDIDNLLLYNLIDGVVSADHQDE